METEDDLERAVRELLAEERRNLGPHPKEAELAAYHGGALSPEEEERIQAHLAACPGCTELLLDFDSLTDPAFVSAVSPVESAAAWRLVQGRLERESAGTPGTAANRGPRPFRPLWLQSLAAVLLLAVGLLGFRVVSLQQRLGDLAEPELNAPVLDLRPSLRSEEVGSAVPEIPPRARLFTLVINPIGAVGPGIYAAEIVDAAGRRVWSGQGLEPNSFGSFSLALSRRMLPAGEYRLQLMSLAAGHRQSIGEYAFRIQSP